MLTQVLDGVRVVELGGSISGSFCARMLADLGAEVVKVEAPEGDPLRRVGPFPGGVSDPDAGGLFAYLNLNKRGATLDPTAPGAPARLAGLLDGARLLVWSREGSLGTDPLELSRSHPGLAVTAVTPFGLTGPYRDWKGGELVVEALAGVLGVTPKLAEGTDREPLKMPGTIGAFMGALHAGVASLAALWGGATGVCVDVAEVEALLPSFTPVFTSWAPERAMMASHRSPAMGWHLAPCKDGHVLVAHGMPGPWESIKRTMGSPAWAEAEEFATVQGRTIHAKAFRDAMQPWLDQHGKAELLELFQSEGGSCAPVYDIAEAMAIPQFGHREFFVTVDVPGAGEVRMPGLPYAPGCSAAHVRRGAPRLGQDDATVWAGA